ncbi:hypothetical protein [Nitrosopumilus adriaticus]|uniref:hypothetical protein n=1 Tax=Nitrosopumilus adriaticus TaxID=1580092 RepID=UPI001F46495A|nr:hypothetical protein [Nitrosopumilus adriaticus]
MKTRFLIIIGIVMVVGAAIALGANIMSENAKQREIKLNQSHLAYDPVTDPICFVVDRATSGETGSAVTMGACISLKQFEEMGCTKPMLEHILRYSNLLDEEVDVHVYLDWAGLPNGVTQEKFDECFDAILEKRPILNSENQDEPNSCPDGQNYNEALFKCVITCEGDLVYNGNTDSCTTHFERKYHGFCNEGFTYQPLTHTCLTENNPDDGIGDLEHTPLKDPPKTAPPEPAVEDVSSIPSAQEFLNMDCEDLNHHYPEFPSEDVADAWITRMHQCLNEQENEN